MCELHLSTRMFILETVTPITIRLSLKYQNWAPHGRKERKEEPLFMSKDLSLYGKIWYAFMCVKLFRSTHTSEATKENVLLLYAIVKNFDIDIGVIISFLIRRCLCGPFSRGLLHPSLICGLCNSHSSYLTRLLNIQYGMEGSRILEG